MEDERGFGPGLRPFGPHLFRSVAPLLRFIYFQVYFLRRLGHLNLAEKSGPFQRSGNKKLMSGQRSLVSSSSLHYSHVPENKTAAGRSNFKTERMPRKVNVIFTLSST